MQLRGVRGTGNPDWSAARDGGLPRIRGWLLVYIALLAGFLLFFLMARRRRTVIVNNVIFNILAVLFLVTWHLIGAKSNIGTVIDSLPNLAGVIYILLSRRVRSTFIADGPGETS